jgi:hypothetical protein
MKVRSVPAGSRHPPLALQAIDVGQRGRGGHDDLPRLP